MVPQGMTKPTIARGLQPQLHHVEASELSVRPTLNHSSGSKCRLTALACYLAWLPRLGLA